MESRSCLYLGPTWFGVHSQAVGDQWRRSSEKWGTAVAKSHMRFTIVQKVRERTVSWNGTERRTEESQLVSCFPREPSSLLVLK